ncbi:DUF2982 domain-containing protein [Vibrio maerlii]|uniref:DUF2982 domain-containing protein n=1 Tax=Vibrio maerlii TaxID=2231648 RepID=UPI0013DF771A|nr:DUF2982 domain-containing protein [Vibrio maerlii]
MPSLHIVNNKLYRYLPLITRWGAFAIAIVSLLLLNSLEWSKALVWSGLLVLSWITAVFILRKAIISYTLTSTHFHQQFDKGGWLLRWQDIAAIELCTYSQQGWRTPLPWIGIRLKDHSHFLNAICPRITTDILMSQRALLYLGFKQMKEENQEWESKEFEDVILDSSEYTDRSGVRYTGLKAMMANRMRYQRQFHGFDLFLSTSDLDRSGEEFVGLLRRYLAAAQPIEFK